MTPSNMQLDWEVGAMSLSSPLGLFVRDCVVAFDALPFEGECRLHARVAAYLAEQAPPPLPPPPREMQQQRAPTPGSDDMSCGDGSSSDNEEAAAPRLRAQLSPACRPAARAARGASTDAPGRDARPPARVASWLASQAEAAERGCGSAPAQLRLDAALRELRAVAPDTPQAQLLRFAGASAARDAPAALEALREYYDHLPLGPMGSAGLSGAAAALAPALRGADDEALGRPQPGASALRGWRAPAALLAAAGVHASAGHVRPAMAALEEAVRAAQSAGDDVALAHALGVLCAAAARSCASDDDARQLLALLARCGARAQELGLPALAAFAGLGAARTRLRAGAGGTGGGPAGAASAARAAERGALDAALAVHAPPGAPTAGPELLYPRAGSAAMAGPHGSAPQLALPAAPTAAQPPPPPPPSPAAAAAAARAAASGMLVCAAAWDARGCPALAAAQTRAYLAAHGATAAVDDVALAHARLCAYAALRQGPVAAAAALAAAREQLAPRGEPEPPALRGAALSLARAAAIARGEHRLAAALTAELAALAPPLPRGLDAEARLGAALAAAATALAAGDLPAAALRADTAAAEARAAGLGAPRVRALLLRAAASAAAGAPLEALPHALAAAATAERLRLEGLRLEAEVAVAQARLDSGAPGAAVAARRDLQAMLPAVLAGGSLATQGRCQLALARALLSCDDDQASRPTFADVAPLLRRALAAHEAAHDRDGAAAAAHALALAAHAAGDTQARDGAAAAAMRALRGPAQLPVGCGGTASLFGLHHLAGLA